MSSKNNRRNSKKRNPPMGTCVHCKKPCFLRDTFIVKGEVWKEAGMGGWNGGYLHLDCLNERIGRELKGGELLVWNVGGNTFRCHPDYMASPEYQEHK
jgi:hypothetical protein